MSQIKIESKRVKSYRTRKFFTIQYFNIGDESYDLNFFTDSGNWIKKMKISPNGEKLTIVIDAEWFDTTDAQEASGIVARIKRECTKNNVEFPFKQVIFNFVSDSD